jgi:mono/diheme cytochrome c family protein
MVVQQVRHSDMHNVGVNHGLTDEQVASMVQYVSKKNASGRERTAAIGHG